ncbi:MAG: hypothetical protein ACRCYD_00785, partial [Plesiomonas sp.]
MTPCEELGYKVGQQFEVIEYNIGYNKEAKVGDIITLIQDDGSSIPYFSSDRKKRFVCNIKRIKPYTGDRTMTLLELLVQELPKRGGWPQWAAAAVQGCNGNTKVLFAGDEYCIRYCDAGWKSTFTGGTWGEHFNANSDFTASTLASDHATRIVTREEYEQAVKPMTFEKVRSMLEDVVRQLTDATSVQIGDDVTPLQRIEQLRKARDEAVRAYNDAFVSGEAELRKLKLGDKIITNSEDKIHNGLVLKLTSINQYGDGREDCY